MLEKYASDIISRYREILTKKDEFARNPIHYAAMAKGNNSLKAIEAFLEIDMDHVPGFDSFFSLFRDV